MSRSEHHAKTKDEVCTPASIYEPVLRALDLSAFDLDPCSHPRAIVPTRRQILLPRYAKGPGCAYKAVEVLYADALALPMPWSGADVWLNPPYAQLRYPRKYPWLQRLAVEADRGVALLPARTSSRWWHEGVLHEKRAKILVQLRGRVHHHGEKWGSPFHQVLVGYNVPETEYARWVEIFEAEGHFVSSLDRMRGLA